MDENTPKTKVCRECGQVLPLNKFYPNSASPDGFGQTCRSCAAAKQSATKRSNTTRNPALAEFTPRQLIEEMRARGYKGELTYTNVIKL